MDSRTLARLIKEGIFPFTCKAPEEQETHISYVLLCDKDVLKFKKSITLDFLDFSTLALRKHFCEEENRLNNRFSTGIYLGVLPVSDVRGKLIVGDGSNVIDYAVHMKRMPSECRMDILLSRGRISDKQIRQLAVKLAEFHSRAEVFPDLTGTDPDQVNDLINYKELASEYLGNKYSAYISDMCAFNKEFIHRHFSLLRKRAHHGMTRDCHGDLHTKNIFIPDEPVIFDCIEFSPSLRKIDLLSDIAFLCMDLEARGYSEFSRLFFNSYIDSNRVCNSPEEYALFQFFKAYRANVRAKISLLSVRSTGDQKLIREARNYLELMNKYKREIELNEIKGLHAPC